MESWFNMKFRNGLSVFYMTLVSDKSDQTGTSSKTCARPRTLLRDDNSEHKAWKDEDLINRDTDVKITTNATKFSRLRIHDERKKINVLFKFTYHFFFLFASFTDVAYLQQKKVFCVLLYIMGKGAAVCSIGTVMYALCNTTSGY
jgi:hypothetical protein